MPRTSCPRYASSATARFFPQAPVEARPFITYDDRITFHFNGEEARVFLAPPAHTDGTLTGTIEALDLAISLTSPQTKVIPGHGVEVVGRQELVQFRDMTVDISRRVRDLIAEGKTLDEVMEEKPTAVYDERWGKEASWTANDFVPVVYYQLGGGSLYEK